MVRLSISLADDEYAALVLLARAEDRSLAAQARRLIREGVERGEGEVWVRARAASLPERAADS